MDKLEYLKKLVSIKSYDTTQNKKIIDYLESEFSKTANEIIKLKSPSDGRESMIVGLNCDLKNINDAIVLAGHIDTVVADEAGYNTNPYIPTEIDGKLYGLGTIDMKSFFGVVLNNMERLKQLNSPIVVVATGDEETTLNGATIVSEKFRELGVVPKLTIVGEPTLGEICSRSKSCYEFEICVTGKRCHSSNPNGGINANYILARLMLKIEELCFKYPDTTLTCNIVSGGEAVNIICDSAKLKFDLRSYSGKYISAVENDIRAYICELLKMYDGAKIEMKINLAIPPLENKNPDLIARLCAKLGTSESTFGAGCEAGYYQAVGGDAIVYGVGDLKLAHKPNEYAEIKEFLKYNDTFVDFVKYCCE